MPITCLGSILTLRHVGVIRNQRSKKCCFTLRKFGMLIISTIFGRPNFHKPPLLQNSTEHVLQEIVTARVLVVSNIFRRACNIWPVLSPLSKNRKYVNFSKIALFQINCYFIDKVIPMYGFLAGFSSPESIFAENNTYFLFCYHFQKTGNM